MFDELFEIFDRDRRRSRSGSQPEQRRGLLGSLSRIFGGEDDHDDVDRSRYQTDDDRDRDRRDRGDGDDERHGRRRERDAFEFGDDD